jgi:hypothetical protein
VEVDGVAGEVAFGPAPVTVFYDQAGIGGQNKIARLAFDELESALLEERNQWDQPGGADFFARPARTLPALITSPSPGFPGKAGARFDFELLTFDPIRGGCQTLRDQL